MKAILFCLILFASLAYGENDPYAEKIAEAQVLYNQGDFKAASQRYEELVMEGTRNGHVFYNLGNSYWRLGDKGGAMAAFLKARQYLPRDPDVKSNLLFVHKSIEDEVAVDFPVPIWSQMFFWIHSFNLKEQFQTLSFLLFVGLCFAAGFMWSPRFNWLKWAAIPFFLGALILSGGFFVSKAVIKPTAAVQIVETQAYSGPSTKGNSVVFKLREGSPVQLLEENSGWVKVGLSDGKRGWVNSQDLKIF